MDPNLSVNSTLGTINLPKQEKQVGGQISFVEDNGLDHHVRI